MAKNWSSFDGYFRELSAEYEQVYRELLAQDTAEPSS
jgi:hypothetical protein